MKVTAQNWRISANDTRYTSALSDDDIEKEDENSIESLMGKEEDTDTFLASLEALKNQKADDSNNFNVKSSKPKDSVGQLAAELARTETRIDVQQVSSKASRALLNLKMSYASCSEKDQKKIAQMIKRMEKLIKRINKKLTHLGKEEQLEMRRKRAEKMNDLQKEELLRNEITTRKKKRRREEREYALKELSQDQKNSSQEMVSGLSGVMQGGTSADGAVGGDLSGMGMGFDGAAVMDVGSVDVMA